ncbi:hypothetical protein NLI96_g5355 [Meripilus lineatus]|uniref:Uncharacterized protein n=1 Tax=Meripilus lineatus TaxID=2056292 RepID=A0AAD5V503_9APHY|nr:hypothetical protein NLI96_g5355 [Physisporinus lineatus]
MKVSPLPQFPSVKGRKTLPPSQLALLRQNILVALDQILSQPVSTHIVTSSLAFVSSYARDHAAGILESLIWESEPKSQYGPKLEQVDQEIHRKTFLLAERISFSLDFQTLLDLSVVYGFKNPKRIRALFDIAFNKNPVLIGQVQKEVAPSFIELLRFSQTGLYGLRKLSHLILSALRPSPSACIGSFARIIPFIVSIAHVYQHDLTNISQSYGGFHSQSSSPNAALDDWQRIILDTKVALLDSFHILISHVFSDVAASQGNHPELSAAENAFDIIYARRVVKALVWFGRSRDDLPRR